MNRPRIPGKFQRLRLAIPAGVWIFLLFFLLFFLGSRLSLDGYELEYVLSAMNIYHGGGPELAPGFEECPGIWNTNGPEPIYPRQHFLQTYLSVPFYALGAILMGESPTIPGEGKFWKIPWGPVLTVSFINPLLSVGIIFLVMAMARIFGVSRQQSRILGVLFGLCTMIWPYAGLGMEVIQTFFLTLTVYCAVRFSRDGGIVMAVLTGVVLILLLNTKKSSFVFVPPLVIYMGIALHRRLNLKKRYTIAVMTMVITTGFLLFLGSYYMKYRADPRFLKHIITKLTVDGPSIIDLIYGLAVSPGEGLFVFNPLLILTIPALVGFYRRNRSEALLFAGIALMLLAALSRVPYVLVDEEWGSRYLHALLPLLFVAGAGGILRKRTGVKKAAVIALVVVSIIIQILGSMYLGFKLASVPVGMGVEDYQLATFMPSLSQIYVAGKCFASNIHRYWTGESLEMTHAQYDNYIGWGPHVTFLRTSLANFDQPVGILFTARWVMAQKKMSVMEESRVFIVNLLLMGWLLGIILTKSGVVRYYFPARG